MNDLKAPLKLRWLIARLGISHKMLADCVIQRSGRKSGQPLSRTAASRMVTEGWRPSGTPWEDVRAAVEALLAEHRATPEEIASCWEPAAEEEGAAAAPHVAHLRAPAIAPRRIDITPWKPSDDYALEQEKEMLTPTAKRHFGLFQDPFINDVNGEADIFMDADIRYIREAMYQAAKQGGWMIAVVGESGSGKTTLRRETIDRIAREGLPVLVCQPESFDKTTLTARHIAEAILADVKPSERPKLSLEALARQVKQALIESSRAGNTHVLMIEEAHDLNVSTLKYLKRFWEMEDGHRKLLSIVLIGQPELKLRLNERTHSEAREVIRRMEVAELLPLDGHMGDYLAMKFKRLGKPLAEVMEEDALGALRERMTLSGRGASRAATISLCYPLVVNNLTTRAMNEAAALGAARITADIVRGLR